MNRVSVCIVFFLALSGCVTNTVMPIQSAPQLTLNQAPPVANRPNPAVAVVNKTALSGAPLHLDFLFSLNADCTSIGYATIHVVTPPAHGTLTNEQGMDYTAFPKENQRYDCNVKKSPGVIVQYKSEAGYVGSDTAVIDEIFASGFSRRMTYNISVK